MTLLNPWALLWLGVAAPVVALYFLKLRRRKVPVSSTWLWARSINDLRVNAPFQKLRKSLLLVLQLLLIALGGLAVADPIGRAAPPEEKRWVFLVDRSASMQMSDVKPTRLDAAKEKAREVLRAAGPKDEVMVVAFSNRAQVMTPLTASRAAIEQAIDAIRPADTATRIQEAVRIAVSALQPFRSREIVILSDGRFEPVQGVADGIDLRYIPVGGTPRNAAITAIEVKRPQRTEDPWTVYAQLDLFHDRELEVPVELHVNGQLKAVKKVTLPPNSSHATLFEVTKPDPSVVEVKLALEDDLAADNRAWASVRAEPGRLLVVSPGNFFLDKAMTYVKDLEAYRTDDPAKKALGDFEVVVLDRIVPDALPEGRYLVLGGVPKWDGIAVSGDVEAPPLIDWDRRHPLTRQVNLANLYIKSCPRVELQAFAIPVAESARTPLVFTYEKGRTRAVVVAFDVLQTDWPLRLSFPIFLANALDWLREADKAPAKPGEPIRVRLGEDETEAEVTGPGGSKERLTGDAGRELVYGATDACGLYGISRKSGTSAVVLNLADPQESSGLVAKELKTAGGRVTAAALPPSPIRPWWRWLAAAVLALLLVEWWVYHRRIEF
jgi:hypothetical protein